MTPSAPVVDARLKRLLRLGIALLEQRLGASLDTLERKGPP